MPLLNKQTKGKDPLGFMSLLGRCTFPSSIMTCCCVPLLSFLNVSTPASVSQMPDNNSILLEMECFVCLVEQLHPAKDHGCVEKGQLKSGFLRRSRDCENCEWDIILKGNISSLVKSAASQIANTKSIIIIFLVFCVTQFT
jgi:hypothetical protein